MKVPLKIGYFADGIWGHNAFKKINANKDFKICFIVPRYDTKDTVLESLSKENKIPYIKSENINSEDFIESIATYECDIFVSMSFNQIFKSEIINIPPLKTINCHAGRLPFYRGRNVLNWAIINNEKEFGITVHFIDDGIDTGDIIRQEIYPIALQDDYKSVLNKAHKECANVLYDALCDIKNGIFKRIPQSEISSIGFYCSQRIEGDEIIEWNQPSLEVYNFIRSICPPAVGARSYINNREIKINKAIYNPNTPKYKCKPGAVVGIESNGNIIIKTLDSTLEICDYQYDGKIKIGDILTATKNTYGGGGITTL